MLCCLFTICLCGHNISIFFNYIFIDLNDLFQTVFALHIIPMAKKVLIFCTFLAILSTIVLSWWSFSIWLLKLANGFFTFIFEFGFFQLLTHFLFVHEILVFNLLIQTIVIGLSRLNYICSRSQIRSLWCLIVVN